jgi:hypothetical protein
MPFSEPFGVSRMCSVALDWETPIVLEMCGGYRYDAVVVLYQSLTFPQSTSDLFEGSA